jgi:predicted Rossmann fold flavoprotein
MVELLSSNGIRTVETENGKIFPESMKARQILDLLLQKTEDSGIQILYGHAVHDVHFAEGTFRVRASGQVFESRNCVITTGGLSYPGTGSSGDGFFLAEKLGHKVTRTTPALTPVTVTAAADALTPGKNPLPGLSGLTLKNTGVTLYRNNRKLTSNTGDLLFTHTGLSGPVILDMSRCIEPGDTVAVSFIQSTYETFEEEFILNSRTEGKRSIKNLLHSSGLPERAAQMILDALGIPHDKKSSGISREERKRLVTLITAFPFMVTSKGDYNVAMATSGGVSLDEINMRTMESKLIPGLFFAGEVMDIDGDTGGYNLQAAFSTGKLAGETISKRI